MLDSLNLVQKVYKFSSKDFSNNRVNAQRRRTIHVRFSLLVLIIITSINTAVYQVFFIESFSIVFSMYIFNPATGNFSCIASNVMFFTVVDDYDQSFFAFFFNKNAYRTPRRPSDPIRLYATPISEILQISLTSSQYEWFQS